MLGKLRISGQCKLNEPSDSQETNYHTVQKFKADDFLRLLVLFLTEAFLLMKPKVFKDLEQF